MASDFQRSQEYDGIAVDIGAEEGGGTARSEGADGHFGVFNPRGFEEAAGGVPEGVGEVLRFAVVPLVVGGVRVVVPVDRLRGVCPPLSVAKDDTPKSFAWADSRVRVWAMTDLCSPRTLFF